MYSSMRLSSAVTLENTTGALRSAPRGVRCPLAGAEYDADRDDDHEVGGGDPATGEPISIACRLGVLSASVDRGAGAACSSTSVEVADEGEDTVEAFASVGGDDVRAPTGGGSSLCPCPWPRLTG